MQAVLVGCPIFGSIKLILRLATGSLGISGSQRALPVLHEIREHDNGSFECIFWRSYDVACESRSDLVYEKQCKITACAPGRRHGRISVLHLGCACYKLAM